METKSSSIIKVGIVAVAAGGWSHANTPPVRLRLCAMLLVYSAPLYSSKNVLF